MKYVSRRGFVACVAAAAVAAAGAALPGCGQDAQSQGTQWLEADPQTANLFLFDTYISFKLYCSEELMTQVIEKCNYFEAHFSRTIEGSDVWNINNATGAPTEVAEETADLIAKSLEYCEASDGLFDITIGAVSSLWDFVEGVRPKDAAIQAALPHIDYHGVHVDGTTVTLDDPQAMIDLGGTAKGYIADYLANMLEEAGCLSGYINLGGNVYVIGSKPDGSDWNVGVEDPNDPSQPVVAALACAETSVVTSGLYERQFEEDGVQYYHILDPKTGYPAESDLVAVSVYGPSSLQGDAYATWMFLLGHDAALELAEGSAGVEAMTVDALGNASQTSGDVFATR